MAAPLTISFLDLTGFQFQMPSLVATLNLNFHICKTETVIPTSQTHLNNACQSISQYLALCNYSSSGPSHIGACPRDQQDAFLTKEIQSQLIECLSLIKILCFQRPVTYKSDIKGQNINTINEHQIRKWFWCPYNNLYVSAHNSNIVPVVTCHCRHNHCHKLIVWYCDSDLPTHHKN